MALRLPTVDPFSAEVPGGLLNWQMCSYTVLCSALYTACVDTSRTVFWDRSVLHWLEKALILVAKLLNLTLADTQVF